VEELKWKEREKKGLKGRKEGKRMRQQENKGDLRRKERKEVIRTS
jgi:hypothetical protein